MMTGKAAGTAKGSPLRQRMIDQMRIANLAESTQIAYLFEIERLAKHYGTSPADLDGEQLRDWILKLIDRGLSPSSTNSTLAAFRFFYVETLGCPERVAGLRNRKKPQALPRHMTEQEVERLILATPDLRHRAAFIAAYGAGLRVSETVNVKIGDIKSDKKCLHIPSGKGGTERMAPLANGVVHYARAYPADRGQGALEAEAPVSGTRAAQLSGTIEAPRSATDMSDLPNRRYGAPDRLGRRRS